MISPSACRPWQPDRAASPAQQRRCYTTIGDTIGADGSTLLTLTPTPDRLVAERRLASGSVHRFTHDADGRVKTAHSERAFVECEHDVSGSRVRDTRDGRGVIHAPGVTTVLDRYTIERDTSRNSVTLRLQGGGSVSLRRLPGGVVRRDFGCGATELLQFDALGRCTASAVALPADAGPWLRSWRYSYEGDLREANCSRNGLTRFRYDAAHRLVEADAGSGKRTTFSHDAAGNLIAQPGLTNVKLAHANRLATANDERILYDTRHNMARRIGPRGAILYDYDSRDLLIRVEGLGASWQAEYDALGRRIRVRHGQSEQVSGETAVDLPPSGTGTNPFASTSMLTFKR